MNPNFFTIFLCILYFCSAQISAQSSTTPSLFPHTNNSSAGSKLYCLGGRNVNGRITFSVSALNTTNNQWESATEMPTPKWLFGATAIGKKIYVCGGDNENERLNLLEVYDCETDTWAELTAMPNARNRIGMTTLNDHIYVSGGWDSSGNVLSSVLKYSPETNTWTEVKAMNEARRGHQLVTLHGAIYAISGLSTNTVERYSPLNDKWAFVESTKHSHSFSDATSHQNKIYILSENGFEVFDPKSDSWQDLPSVDISEGLQLVSINDKLLAVGVGIGNDKGRASKSVYEFDTANNSWIHLPDMDFPRRYHQAVVVNF